MIQLRFEAYSSDQSSSLSHNLVSSYGLKFGVSALGRNPPLCPLAVPCIRIGYMASNVRRDLERKQTIMLK